MSTTASDQDMDGTRETEAPSQESLDKLQTAYIVVYALAGVFTIGVFALFCAMRYQRCFRKAPDSVVARTIREMRYFTPGQWWFIDDKTRVNRGPFTPAHMKLFLHQGGMNFVCVDL